MFKKPKTLKRNISEKGTAYRVILGMLILEFASFYDFQFSFLKSILLLIATYYFICAIFKISPIYKLLKINTYNKRIYVPKILNA